MRGTMADALSCAGIKIKEEDEYYKKYSDIPLQMYSIPVWGILKDRSREGLRFSTGLREEILSSVNHIVNENKGLKGVSEEFIRDLPILEDKTNNVEIRDFLIRYKERIVLCNGYGVAVSYDRRNLSFSFLQNNHGGLGPQISKKDMLSWIEKGIRVQAIPFICLKVNYSIILREPVTKSNYLFSAYGYNILNDSGFAEHLGDWYAKFGKKNVKRDTVYHICSCQSRKYKDQWYLIKAKEESDE